MVIPVHELQGVLPGLLVSLFFMPGFRMLPGRAASFSMARLFHSEVDGSFAMLPMALLDFLAVGRNVTRCGIVWIAGACGLASVWVESNSKSTAFLPGMAWTGITDSRGEPTRRFRGKGKVQLTRRCAVCSNRPGQSAPRSDRHANTLDPGERGVKNPGRYPKIWGIRTLDRLRRWRPGIHRSTHHLARVMWRGVSAWPFYQFGCSAALAVHLAFGSLALHPSRLKPVGYRQWPAPLTHQHDQSSKWAKVTNAIARSYGPQLNRGTHGNMARCSKESKQHVRTMFYERSMKELNTDATKKVRELSEIHFSWVICKW